MTIQHTIKISVFGINKAFLVNVMVEQANANLPGVRLYFKKLICSVEEKRFHVCFYKKSSLNFCSFQTKAVSKHVNKMMSSPHTGRFDDSVIEERRQCSEDLLQFSANIPALYNSQHIQEFFKVRKTGTQRNPQMLLD